MSGSGTYQRNYRAKNIERLRKRDREYKKMKYATNKKCREYALKNSQIYYSKNAEQKRGYAKEYARKNRERDHSKSLIRVRLARLTVKGKARAILGNAVQSGKIIRPDNCSKCFKQCKPHGHHPNYSEPLNVVWVCAMCHSAIHNGPRPRKK